MYCVVFSSAVNRIHCTARQSGWVLCLKWHPSAVMSSAKALSPTNCQTDSCPQTQLFSSHSAPFHFSTSPLSYIPPLSSIRWSDSWWRRSSPWSSLETGSPCLSIAPLSNRAPRARCSSKYDWILQAHLNMRSITVCHYCLISNFLLVSSGRSRERDGALSVPASGNG